MNKPTVANPWAAIQKIANGVKFDELHLFVRDPAVWCSAVEGAHYLAGACKAVPKDVHDELAKLFNAIP